MFKPSQESALYAGAHPAALAADEGARLTALHDAGLLDTLPEAAFDDIVQIAATLCGTPIALVSLIDSERQWFKAKLGLDVPETHRDLAFCAHAINTPQALFEIADAAADPRFAGNPLVTGDPNIRFYAGAPLVTDDGHALGTLCVIDRVPRELDAAQRDALTALGRRVMNEVKLRRQLAVLDEARRELDAARELAQQRSVMLETIVDALPSAVVVTDLDGKALVNNREAQRLSGYPSPEIPTDPEDWPETYGIRALDGRVLGLAEVPIARAMRGETVSGEEVLIRNARRSEGTVVEVNAKPLRDAEGRQFGAVTVFTDINDRKRANDALKASEAALKASKRELEYFRLIAEGTEVFVALAGLDRKVTYVNPAGRAAFGLKSMAAAQQTELLDYIFPRDLDKAAGEWLPSLMRDGHFNVEIDGRHFVTGAVVPMLWRAFLIRDPETGEPYAVAAMGPLLAERRRLEAERAAEQQALAESEARYRQLSDDNPAVLLRCRALPGWPMVYISKAVEGITGYAPSEFIEQGLLGQLVLEEDVPRLLEAIAAQQALGGTIKVSYRIRHRNGDIRWLEGHATPITLSDGSAGFDGAITDITASQHAELALADSERRFRQLADNNPTMLYRSLNQPGWPMVYMSRAVEAITGYPATAFTDDGLLIGSLVLPEAIPMLVEQVEAQLAVGNVVQVEYPLRHRDGSVRWLDAYGVLQTFADGSEGFEGAIADITEQKDAERLLVERAAALERANAELDEFTYVASHDLKEPLRGIHNYARFLSEDYAGQLDAGGQQMLKVVSEQAGRMQRLIDDLMHIARLGREPIEQAEADLDAMLDEVLASLDFSLQEKNVSVQRHPLGHLICAKVRVAELFRNLITNAIKYTDKPAPTIEIGRTVRDGKTAFFVRDNGIGIKPEFHARVFAPFKRLHAKSAYGGGTGVGLTIVKRIVEAHDGRIEIESTPGHGASFIFTLSSELNS